MAFLPFDAMAPIGPLSHLRNGNISESPSPIHGVPFELLADIMVLAVTPHDTGIIGRIHPPVAAHVLLLCQVCSFWRQVALNTPRLWIRDNFPICAREKGGWHWQITSPWTQMFLERSGSLPISVYFFRALPTPNVVSAAHRWKRLEIKYVPGDPAFDATVLARIPSDGLQSLEKLRLIWYKSEIWQGPELDIFLFAPRLRDVIIHGPHIPPLPWTQLTRLSLENDLPQLCLDILVRCRNLVSARIDTRQWLESDHPDTLSVVGSGFLPHLEEFEIDVRLQLTGEHLGPFLRRLKLPTLKSLALSLRLPFDDEEYFVPWLTPSLISFLTRSPNLESFKIGSCDDCVFSEDVQNILQHTPELTELSFNNSELYDNFFEALRYSETDPQPSVPKLETLVLLDVGESFSEESFVEMLRSRWWTDDERLAMPTPPNIARLKRVTLQNFEMERDMRTTSFAPELRDAMAVYRSQGLDFSDSGYDLDV